MKGQEAWENLLILDFLETYNQVRQEASKSKEKQFSISDAEINLFKTMWDNPHLSYEQLAKKNGVSKKPKTLKTQGMYIFRTISKIIGQETQKRNFYHSLSNFLKKELDSNEVENLRGIAMRDESIRCILNSENSRNVREESQQTGKTKEEIVNEAIADRYQEKQIK